MDSTDWRYDNIQHLHGATFRLAQYKAPSADWDHDHCKGCWATFADFDGTGILHEGYVTASPDEGAPEPEFITRCKERGMACVPQPTVNGALLHWVCPECFEGFRRELGFQLES
jgi:hypothetical protein